MQIKPDWLFKPQLQMVFERLEQAGFCAYGVGGCVRNTLLGFAPGDIDLCSDATPKQVEAVFANSAVKILPTGIAHGTLTLVYDSMSVEITSFRQDIDTDGRHAVVRFGADITTDAKRRDFTMNALYVDRHGHLHDPIGGLDDLQMRYLRFVGNAHKRIKEDYLRILRFFRFNAIYADPAKGLDGDGLAACAAGLDGLAQIPKERTTREMQKMLGAIDPAPAVASMAQIGVLQQILPAAHITALAPLIALENGKITDWHTRLSAIFDSDPLTHLRLSKRDYKRVMLITQNACDGIDAAEIAYHHGAVIARNCALLRAALFNTAPAPDMMARIALGTDAIFPLACHDLPAHITGIKIGEALRSAQTRWIASDFTLKKQELLDGLD